MSTLADRDPDAALRALHFRPIPERFVTPPVNAGVLAHCMASGTGRA